MNELFVEFMQAIRANNADRIMELLQELSKSNLDINTPIMLENSSTNILELLVLKRMPDAIRKAVRLGADPDSIGSQGISALQRACKGLQEATVKILLPYSQNPMHVSTDGETALEMLYQVRLGIEAQELLPVRDYIMGGLLRRIGAINVDLVDTSPESPQLTALAIASKFDDGEKIAFLLNRGANRNHKDIEGNTPLHHACSTGERENIELLLASGAVPNSGNCYGNTPLHVLLDQNYEDINVVLLLIFAINNLYFDEGIIEDISSIINKGNIFGQTILHFAARSGCTGIIDDLILNHANPEVRDNQGNTPLQYALKFRLEDEYEEDKDIAGTIQKFIDCGADILTRNDKENTLLHTLCKSRITDPYILEFLLEYIPVNATNAKNETPLHLACLAGNVEYMNALLDAEDNPLAVAADNKNILHYACMQTDDLPLKDPAISTMLLNRLAENNNIIKCLSNTDDNGNTPLHIAASQKQFIQLFYEFLHSAEEYDPEEFYALLGIKNKENMTILDIATANNCGETKDFLLPYYNATPINELGQGEEEAQRNEFDENGGWLGHNMPDIPIAGGILEEGVESCYETARE